MMSPSLHRSTRVGAIATALLLTASVTVAVPPAGAALVATTHAMTTARYHVELPGSSFGTDQALGVPNDVMHDGTSSAGATGGNVGAAGSLYCSGSQPFVFITTGQGFSASAQGTADFGLLRAHADAGIENTPGTIICPDTPPAGNDAPGATSAFVTVSFSDFITVGSASGLPAGTMKRLRFTAVLGATVGGDGYFGGNNQTGANANYYISASVLFGSPNIITTRTATGVETFPPSGVSSAEVDVAVGTLFSYGGALSASAQASAGGGLATANATADASNTAHAYIDSDDPDVVLTSASLHDYRSGVVGSTTTTTTIASTTSTIPLPALHLVSGASFLLKDSAVPKKRKAAFTSRDPAFTVAGFDPRTGGAEVRLFGPSTGASDVWTLPANGWSFKKGRYRYANKTPAHGPMVSASLANQRITLKAKGAAIGYPLLGGGPQHAIAVALVFPAGPAGPIDAICADFPGVLRGLKTDDATKGVLRAAKAEAPGSCRAFR